MLNKKFGLNTTHTLGKKKKLNQYIIYIKADSINKLKD
jgi:hypothetical protein